MCYEIAQLYQSVASYAARFDAALVAPEELGQVVYYAGRIEKLAGHIASFAAARLAGGAGNDGPGPRHDLARQAAEQLARATGTTLGTARKAVEVARRLQRQPEVAGAVRAGELSRAQAELVSSAVEASPSAAPRLLEVARTGSLAELAEEAGRATASSEDLEARRQRVHASRSLRTYTSPGGTWHLHAQGLPEDGARIMARVQRLADEAFDEARKAGRHERPEAYAFDGLVKLATSGAGQATSYEVMVRVDLATLLRGYPCDGETCEIAGFGPVSTQAVYDLMGTADPFLKSIVTKGKQVVGVAHLGRRPNAYQQTALDWLFPTCAAEGCSVRAGFLQTDHRQPWAGTRFTVFDLLDRLCRRHHAMKTYHNWALVEGKGKRAFVPPEDPRHPQNHRAAPTAGQPP